MNLNYQSVDSLMKLVIGMEGFDHAIATCERCLGRVISNPEGYDRPCIIEQEDDGSDLLTLILRDSNGQEKSYLLDQQQQQLLVSEGWSVILDEIDQAPTD